jgi:hypothetical protein
MSSEIEAVRQVIVPQTGEVLDLTTETTDRLAEAFDQIKELETQLAAVRRRVGEEMAARLDHEAVRSFEAGKWKIEVDAPVRYTWNPDDTRKMLTLIAETGHISQSAVDRACVPSWKVSAREVEKIARILPEGEAQMLQTCREESTRARSVRVKLNGDAR